MITWLFTICRMVNLVLIAVLIFYKRKEPALLLAWILILLFLPPVGLILYLLFERTPRLSKKVNVINEFTDQRTPRDLNVTYSPTTASIISFNEQYNHSQLRSYNEWTYFSDGKTKFDQLFTDLEQATTSIHLLYFIIRKDEVGDQLISILTQKALDGVEVRLVYDCAGSFPLSSSYFSPLIEAGGHVFKFHPPTLIRLRALNYNYRNHRKIVVIDGRVAYFGGMNIGKEYMSLDSKFSPWRDSHLRVMGDCVWDLQHRFFRDYFMVCDDEADEDYVKERLSSYFSSPITHQICPIQVVSDGPDTPTDDIKLAFVKMMQMATQSIRIQTPYFIPDQLFLETLKIAAYSGVKVEVMIPTIADHHYVYLTTTSFIKELLEANIAVYLYEGFLHSKIIIIDHEICTIGSTNIDQRSFKINYEVNAFIYDKKLTDVVDQQFNKDFENCRVIDETYDADKTMIRRLEEGVYRLVSQIL